MVVRMEMTRYGIAQWQLAEVLGVHENTVQRLLRSELPAAKQKELLTVTALEEMQMYFLLKSVLR